MRHRSIALSVAVLASFVLASVALAGGWAQVSAKNVPVDPPAGEETTIDLGVLQHGVTPVSWPDLTVVATDATSGAVVRAEAKAKGTTGSYVATIVFPTAGDWKLTFDSVDLVMEGSVAMHVAPPIAAAPAGTPAEQAPAPASFVGPLLVVLLAVGAILVIGGLAMRGRGGSAGSRASART
jgi:hypothetical protein